MPSLETGTMMNAPQEIPEDDRLAKDMEGTLQRAIDAAKYHRVELERAERVARSCKAAMEQLNARELMPHDEPAKAVEIEGSLGSFPPRY